MYTHYMYSSDMLYRSVCSLVIQSYILHDEVVTLLTSKKYTVLNQNCVFDLHNVFQEHNPVIKQDVPVMFCNTKQLHKCAHANVYLHKTSTDPITP